MCLPRATLFNGEQGYKGIGESHHIKTTPSFIALAERSWSLVHAFVSLTYTDYGVTVILTPRPCKTFRMVS
jgi:hypothetical protein